MPFIDWNTSSVHFDPEAFDIVIVGAGAAGILLAMNLSEKNKRVLLVESGHFAEDDARQVLNEVEQAGKAVTSAVWGRKRAIGGTTIAWGGQSLPFGMLDFEKRPWVAESGWPFGYEELRAYYLAANRFMNIDELDYEDDVLRLLKMKRPDIDARQLHFHFSKWAPEPDFRKLYEDQLRTRVTVVYNAVLTRLHDDGGSRVTGITISNFQGRQETIKTRMLILAPGCIEANRILLLHRRQENTRNRFSEWLGKCFMEHPCIEVGDVRANRLWRLQENFNTHVSHRRKYSIRLSLAEEQQRQEKLLNGSASILFRYENEEMDPYNEVRQLLRQRRLGNLRKLPFAHFKALVMGATALGFRNFVYKHNSLAKLIMMMEQEPSTDSYIELGDKKDQFGLTKVNLNWQISFNTWRSVVFLSNAAKKEIERAGFGKVQLYEHIEEKEPSWNKYLSDVNHHMGGTRMSASPDLGIVDPELRVWGFDNLYICSTAVFPTGSHSNPTLTLLALAQRLADKLSKQ
ncbi:GMC family oxidoreductase [Puia sp.]|jgi:choline dehydrogenase-like flavoprotein|uniref:GMC family oxidoreductase n=1 Tax=Puia sp. TaxID=2045100 RepID=UPI002F3E4095